MATLEIEEFSTVNEIRKFIRTVNMPNFIARYFDKEPVYTAAVEDAGGTVLTFQDYPLEIAVSGAGELAVFVDFRKTEINTIKILNSVDKASTESDVVRQFGCPDFEINEEKRIKLGHNAKVIKYFIDDEYSISFDYNKNIELVSIFRDKYR